MGLACAAPLASAAYATEYECGAALVTTPYAVRPPAWTAGPRLKIAVIADIHAARPWMGERRVADIVALANALKPDLTVLLGDYVCTHPYVSSYVPPGAWAEALSGLKAPLGVFAILGNHDWWSAAIPTDPPDGAQSVRKAIAQARIPLLENRSLRFTKDGKAFWLIGLGDQLAHQLRAGRPIGDDDLNGALAQVTDDAPTILLAHEPYIFHRVPERVALTLSGHTHGGQVNLPFVRRAMARRMGAGSRLIYGPYASGDRRLIVSGGLGTSIAPVRVLRPPEVVVLDVAAPGVG